MFTRVKERRQINFQNTGSRSKARGGQTAVKVHQQKKGRRKKMMDCKRHDEGQKRHRGE